MNQGIPYNLMKKCLQLFGSGQKAMPGTGSVCMVLVSFTILGLGPSIFVDYWVNYIYQGNQDLNLIDILIAIPFQPTFVPNAQSNHARL